MGYNFENNSDLKPIILRDSTYTGSYLQQSKQILFDAGIANNNFENGTLAIWPKNGYRVFPIATISDKTGMVGYPTYTMFGFSVTTVYDPKLIFGGLVMLETSYKPAYIPTGANGRFIKWHTHSRQKYQVGHGLRALKRKALCRLGRRNNDKVTTSRSFKLRNRTNKSALRIVSCVRNCMVPPTLGAILKTF